MIRKFAAGLALGIGAVLIVLAIGRAGLLQTAEMKAYDWRMRAAADASSVDRDIVLVEITDTTIRDLAQVYGHWPWPRVAFSSVIDFLHRAPAKVIAVDLLFAEPDRVKAYTIGDQTWSGAESDAALADSIKAAGNVVLLADAVNEGVRGGAETGAAPVWRDPGYRLGSAIEERPVILPPLPPLASAAMALGHNFLALDDDGPARRMAPFVRHGERYLPSLGIAAAFAADGIRPGEVRLDGRTLDVRGRHIPLVPTKVTSVYDPRASHDQLTMLIDYRAPVIVDGKPPYPTYELRHVWYSEQQMLAGEKPLIDPSAFRNKIVFIGLNASGLGDVFVTPFGSRGTMPGIQLHASMADSVLANRFIRPAPPASRVASVAIAAAGVGLFSTFLPFAAALAATLAVLGGWTWLTFAAFETGLWLNLVQPVSAGAIALFAGTAYRYFVEGREKRIVKRLFGRYVSRDVYAQLLEHPELAELGGRRRDMTVLFSDIRGFTTVTERGEPEHIVAQLNEYFSRMVEVVFRHGGTVDKFVGDMVMALFGAPLDDPRHPDHAVEAARDMIAELGALNRRWAEEGRPQLDIGIGVNSGEMIAGNIGSSSIMSYTVIGDNVNLGSRLESLNKEYRTRIIISDATRTRLTDAHDVRPLGDVVVKGKTRPVAIYELCVPAPLVQPTDATAAAAAGHVKEKEHST
ncbi:MAG TPA: adenylate/guanylate cyclase domain-containing protein [Vicinamibacterales bacterium]|nr:adenylate/guanylate cyclase domain-containing protein [Vicinamibacterales bacterium]